MGCVQARLNLAIYWEETDFNMSIRHCRLAAAAGFDKAVEKLWEYFYTGKVTKVELETSLRDHQRACDEVKSEERERYAAYKNAAIGDDKILRRLCSSYYCGKIKAKELNAALKEHRSNG